jgi:hypothetical protein
VEYVQIYHCTSLLGVDNRNPVFDAYFSLDSLSIFSYLVIVIKIALSRDLLDTSGHPDVRITVKLCKKMDNDYYTRSKIEPIYTEEAKDLNCFESLFAAF